MKRYRGSLLISLAFLAAALLLAGCSRVELAYNSAEPLLKLYADDYLGLDGDQLTLWEPRLEAALARHRAEELPYLAAFFGAMLEASRLGFDNRNADCLVASFKDLYRRHATFAAGLVAPLLAGLTTNQINALEQRFLVEYEDDRSDPARRDIHREQRKRADRYRKAIEDWTGPLGADQRTLIADVTARMPDTAESVLAYRTRKRAELIALLRAGTAELPIRAFLESWLVDYRDLPPDLERAGEAIGDRIAELLVRLGASLNDRQRARLEQRLRQLRDDLMDLQEEPRVAPLAC